VQGFLYSVQGNFVSYECFAVDVSAVQDLVISALLYSVQSDFVLYERFAIDVSAVQDLVSSALFVSTLRRLHCRRYVFFA